MCIKKFVFVMSCITLTIDIPIVLSDEFSTFIPVTTNENMGTQSVKIWTMEPMSWDQCLQLPRPPLVVKTMGTLEWSSYALNTYPFQLGHHTFHPSHKHCTLPSETVSTNKVDQLRKIVECKQMIIEHEILPRLSLDLNQTHSSNHLNG